MKSIVTCILSIVLMLATLPGQGQVLTHILADDYDTNYIESYKHQLTSRIYSSRKFTRFTLRDRAEKAGLHYRPNPQLNLGIGATYNAFTLNLGFNFPFINDDDDIYGKTDYLDLQTHVLLRKFTLEFYFSITEGYHISNPSRALLNHEPSPVYPQRPDIFTINLGGQAYYIFNNKRFSYRAAFNHDERQIKSAGTLLAGPALYSNFIRADSSIIPAQINPPGFFDDYRISSSRYTRLALGGGYAYNFIIKKSFFVTLSLMVSGGAGFMKIEADDATVGDKNNFDLSFTYTVRAATGYNGKKFFAGVSFVNMAQNTPVPIPKATYLFYAGNLRLNISYRFGFDAGEKWKQKLF